MASRLPTFLALTSVVLSSTALIPARAENAATTTAAHSATHSATNAPAATAANSAPHTFTRSQTSLNLEGARALIQAAETMARKLNAPSSIAVVDANGDVLAFEQMEGARSAGIDTAQRKARAAARFELSTDTLEDAVNKSRPAILAAGEATISGGVPIRLNGAVVGAVGVAGFDKTNDVRIAEEAASTIK